MACLSLNAQDISNLEGRTLANFLWRWKCGCLTKSDFREAPISTHVSYTFDAIRRLVHHSFISVKRPHTIPNLSLLEQEDTETVYIISDQTAQVSSNHYVPVPTTAPQPHWRHVSPKQASEDDP